LHLPNMRYVSIKVPKRSSSITAIHQGLLCWRRRSSSLMPEEERDKISPQSELHQLYSFQLFKGASRTKLFIEW